MSDWEKLDPSSFGKEQDRSQLGWRIWFLVKN